MLLLAFEGATPPAAVLDAVRRGEAAGVALYATLNVESPTQLRGLGDAIQGAARAGRQPAAIVAIDQEGGQLMAFPPPATMFAGNLALAATGSADLARRVGRAMGLELAAAGCNVDWAPDADLATTPHSPAVGARSFGDDAALAGQLTAALVEGLQSAGVAACVKHFPGAGETAADPHFGLPVVAVPGQTMQARELLPFRTAIAAEVRLVMISHAAYPGLEGDGSTTRPALASPAILRELLRERLGFSGVVVSDALDMGAVDQSDVPGATLAAVAAGVDLLLLGPAQASRTAELAAILAGLRSRPADVAPAAARVAALREWLAATERPSLEVVGCDAHRALAAELARRSMTLLRDRDGLLPLHPAAGQRLLVITPRPADLTPADTSSSVTPRLADAVRRRHSATEGLEVPIDPSADDIATALSRAADADVIVLGSINAFAFEGQLELGRRLAALGRPLLLVALRMPTDAQVMPHIGTAIAAYSIHDPSTEAAAAVLFGEVAAEGRLPIAIDMELRA